MDFLNNKRIQLIALIGLLLLFCFGNLVSRLTEHDGYTAIRIVEKKHIFFDIPDSQRPVIKFLGEHIAVVGHPFLEMKSIKNNWVEIFAPKYLLYDPIYLLCAIIILLIFLVRAKKLDPDKPFTSQFITGVKWAGITALLFGLADYLRIYWLSNYISVISGDSYHLQRFSISSSLLTWLGLLLLILNKIFKKAGSIQKDQELTI